MKQIRNVLLPLVLMCLVGPAAALYGTEKDIPLSKVPKRVLAAAQKAVPGIKFTEAEVKKTSKGILYEVEGLADGKKYEITLTPDGKVLGVQQEEPDKEGQEDEPDDKDDKD